MLGLSWVMALLGAAPTRILDPESDPTGTTPTDPDSQRAGYDSYISELCRHGVALLPIDHQGKLPADTRTPAMRTRDAAELAAAVDAYREVHGCDHPHLPRTVTPGEAPGGVYLASSNPARVKTLVKRYFDDRGVLPNLAIAVGRSPVIVVDADTPAEVAAWHAWAERHAGVDDQGRPRWAEAVHPLMGWRSYPSPTISTPGTTGADGRPAHHGGGHWYFTLPGATGGDDLDARRGWEADCRAARREHEAAARAWREGGRVGPEPVLHLPPDPADSPEMQARWQGFRFADFPSSMTITVDGVGSFTVMIRQRYVLIPPSRRAEGRYRLTGEDHPAEDWLLPALVAENARRKENSAARVVGGAGAGGTGTGLSPAAEDALEGIDWGDILREIHWEVSGTGADGAVIWRRPGGSSPRSACEYADGRLHVWSTDDPDLPEGSYSKAGAYATIHGTSVSEAITALTGIEPARPPSRTVWATAGPLAVVWDAEAPVPEGWSRYCAAEDDAYERVPDDRAVRVVGHGDDGRPIVDLVPSADGSWSLPAGTGLPATTTAGGAPATMDAAVGIPPAALDAAWAHLVAAHGDAGAGDLLAAHGRGLLYETARSLRVAIARAAAATPIDAAAAEPPVPDADTLDQWLADADTPVRLLRDMWYPQALHLLVGPPTAGKTWACLDLLAGAGAGLYLDLDANTPAALASRYVRLGGAREDLLQGRVRLVSAHEEARRQGVTPLEAVRRLAAWALEEATATDGAYVVVVDSMTQLLSAAGEDSNSDTAVTAGMQTFGPLAERACVVIADHVGHEAVDRPRGSTAKSDAAHAVLVMRPTEPRDGATMLAAHISIAKDRYAALTSQLTAPGDPRHAGTWLLREAGAPLAPAGAPSLAGEFIPAATAAAAAERRQASQAAEDARTVAREIAALDGDGSGVAKTKAAAAVLARLNAAAEADDAPATWSRARVTAAIEEAIEAGLVVQRRDGPRKQLTAA
ncbi:hypothetical protein CSPHI_08410 [Corynebacterium sphenisci DSM 44792]|uniref:DNA primase/polymerase bifunctional N-terminal domain-containing protein n=1 Tax=Corynebacterium sphenisci DSM 44792 TaxID=1437874 RepID=A0A1L7CYS7_9CORY|nr:AAA family ATPase [Corynebacterium sphenisci]APT91049.1 hypothetical protein CSPHI_08410 [Corynebacterium sphenisci DSM 44792]